MTRATRMHNVLFNMYQDYKKDNVGKVCMSFDEFKAYKIAMMANDTLR